MGVQYIEKKKKKKTLLPSEKQIPSFTTTINDKYDKGSQSTFGTLDWLPQRPDLNITEAV